MDQIFFLCSVIEGKELMVWGANQNQNTCFSTFSTLRCQLMASVCVRLLLTNRKSPLAPSAPLLTPSSPPVSMCRKEKPLTQCIELENSKSEKFLCKKQQKKCEKIRKFIIKKQTANER